jgi:hypothetical protein
MQPWEYITDPRFEVLGCGTYYVGKDMKRNQFVWPDVIAKTFEAMTNLYGVNWPKLTVVVQNAQFDPLILRLIYGITPEFIIDVKHLAAHQDSKQSHRLKDLAKHYGLQEKGKTEDFKSLHFADMSIDKRRCLALYCENDCDLEQKLFESLLPRLSWPGNELWNANHTLHLYLEPKIVFNAVLATELQPKMQVELDRLIGRTGFTAKQISGNKSIVKLFEQVLPPEESIPLKQGKPTKEGLPNIIPALAKNDDGCNYLLAHPKKEVAELIEARLAIKSWPNHLKRIAKMEKFSDATGGLLPVPLNYYGSHTGRVTGGGKINLCNLGGSGRAGSGNHPLIKAMRGLLLAPAGKTFILCDSAQIEARLLAWIARCVKLVMGFANKEDIYSEFATTLFGCPVHKPVPEDDPVTKQQLEIQRGFGKDAILGCIAEGSLVLTNSGFKPIETVTINDRVWDGFEFVEHGGAICRGKKFCVEVNGTWLTPEHEILHLGVWTTAAELSIRNQKSGKNTENLPLSALYTDNAAGLSPSNAVAPAVENLLRQGTTWSPENLHGVMSVLKSPLTGIKRLFPNFWMSQDMIGWLAEFVQCLNDASTQDARHFRDMVDEVSQCGVTGSRIEHCLFDTLCHYLDGTTPDWKLTELITIMDTNRAISDLQRGRNNVLIRVEGTPESGPLKTASGAAEGSLQKRPGRNTAADIVLDTRLTFDIMLAGPRKRFQVDSLICGNCGYGMGWNKFWTRCLENKMLRPHFDSGEYTAHFMVDLVETYRTKYAEIPAFWTQVEKMFRWVVKYPHEHVRYGKEQGFSFDILQMWNDRGTVNVQLPSSRILFYPHAAVSIKDNQLRYEHGHLWGGTLTENVIQSIGRDLLMTWLRWCEEEGIHIVHHVYDELIGLVPIETADEDLAYMQQVMETAPEWAEGVPLGSEGKISLVYTK